MKIDREAIRIMVADFGYEETAQRTGIKNGTLRQWARRFHWKAPIPHAQSVVTTVTRPLGQVHADALQDHSKRSKLAFAKAVTKASEHLATLEPEKILKSSRQMKDTAQTGAVIHREWTEGKNGSGTLNLAILGGQTAIQVVQNPPPDPS